jgi:putative membrane protein
VADEDPRIYFAAERTLLAWVRTGIAVMAFGFVVARFGVFLSLVTAPGLAQHPIASRLSPYIGAALVVIGAAAIAAGTLEYRRYCDTLRPEDLPSPHATRLPQSLAWLIVSLGFLLVFVLLI